MVMGSQILPTQQLVSVAWIDVAERDAGHSRVRRQHCAGAPVAGKLTANLALPLVAWLASWPSSDPVPWLFFLVVLVKQFEETLAHDYSRPVGRHVHFDLSAHVDDGVRIGRFEHLAILGDDRSVPVDQFLGGAVRLGVIAEQ